MFRHKHPDVRRYTFSKKQACNHTRARLDYFLTNDDSLDLVSKVGMGRENNLSDHSPIYLHLNLSKIKKGRGFWRLNCDFLKEPEFIFGINHTLERVIKQYSNNVKIESPQTQEPTPKPLLIPYTLLHDVLLIEGRSFALRYAAEQKRKMLSTIADLNKKIDKKSNSVENEDIEEVFFLKHEVQNLEEERDMAIARKKFTQMQLEGERPTKFFCKMNKKIGSKAQFETLHVEDVDENGVKTIIIVQEQDAIEQEVREFYCNLYMEKEAAVDKNVIL